MPVLILVTFLLLLFLFIAWVNAKPRGRVSLPDLSGDGPSLVFVEPHESPAEPVDLHGTAVEHHVDVADVTELHVEAESSWSWGSDEDSWSSDDD